jgi:C-methyltransferase C-terminal domain/Putative zinc binding domain/Methyltransferase domain
MRRPVVSSTVDSTTATSETGAGTAETAPVCRACGGRSGEVVLDLGLQPACDYFPHRDDPGPDPEYPLRMWLCARCGLAQLLEDPTVPEEPRGAEPAALAAQAADAVRLVGEAGLLPAGGTVAEYGSPHGGSWLDLLAVQGLKPVAGGDPADVIVDCFGMMHAADQAAALAERAARLAPGGILLLQYHSLAAIIRQGQWNALRHGHYAYYSTTAMAGLLAAAGLRPRTAWQFELYGGTILLAAERAVGTGEHAAGDGAVRAILENDAAAGVRDPAALRGLERDVQARVAGLRDWLSRQRAAGRSVLGYGAASRAVALLCQAGVDRSTLPAVADASRAKQGLRMPGTDIPVVSPAEIADRRPDAMLLFLADLRAEVTASYPEVEANGGSWVDADALGS